MERNWSQKDVEGENNNFTKHIKRGGWKTFPFILGSTFGQTLASGGWGGNLIVYLITKYNVKSIDATQVNNVVQGCFNFFPIVAAIISDSFFGPFPLIAAFSFVSLLGVTLTTFTSAFHSLRPPPCLNPLQCDHSPSKLQYGVLYMALGLACIGFGGTRFTTTTMGADQFESPKDQENYFNITFCFFYVGYMISSTAIIYVQDNVSWTVGFGICVACNAVAVILFLFGNKIYRHIKPKGSPFTSMARVIVAAVKKRRVHLQNQQYNYDTDDTSTTTPSDSFRFLNRGALKIESDGPKSRSWSLSTVQEVEDLKTLIRIMPLWSSGLLLTTLISMFGNFTILQALTMDRHLHHASHFQIPPASFLFFNTLASCISLFILDRFIFPTWQNLIGWPITPLQRIGVGHILNFVGFVSCALIEIQRLDVARAQHLTGSSVGGAAVVPFSALWLVVPLTILGIGEAFHFPGQFLLYYQEFPASLHSSSTAMVSLLVAIGFYLSTGITSLIRRNTGWLMDDINDGRLDMVYWLLAAIGLLNFGYFLICVKMFRYKLDKNDDNNRVIVASSS